MKLIRATLLLALMLAATAAAVPAAQAATIFDYEVSVDDGASAFPASGDVRVEQLDTTKTTRIIVSPPTGPNRYDSGVLALGASGFSTPDITSLTGGDTITVRQPGTSLAPTESIVIPPIQINLSVGAGVITGFMPAGVVGAIYGENRCNDRPVPHSLPSGSFSIPYGKMLPGEKVQAIAATLDGDDFYYLRHAPGESPCVEINAHTPTPPATGDPPNATPYDLEVSNLNADVALSVRAVLRRGALILSDTSADALSINAEIAPQPLPGDVIDIYRPKTALTPSHSRTIPAVSAVFDSSAELVAVNGPAAAQIMVGLCRAFSCPMENIRTRLDVAAGRTFFDFKAAEGLFGPVDLRADDRVGVVYNDPDNLISHTFTAVPGDLVAPQQSLKLPGKLKLATLRKALKKGYKVKLKSNESGVAKLALTLPAATSSAKKKSRPVTLATATKSVKVGTTTITLKFTKSGRKAIKKLSRKRSRSVVLTSTVTDASGNASTIVKKTKIKP
ncbi:MAG: hypothetical protein ACSLFF_05360 [Solirubrobacterales bacterium]